jgi:two-component system, OmpR family, copper resistance phosphate regulon response regulator CusR
MLIKIDITSMILTVSRILIVEDEPQIAAFLEKGLRKHGYETTIATDGEEALQMLERGLFDLLLLDIGLPVKDGWTVLKELQKRQREIPDVIVLTARSDDSDRLNSIQLGAKDYITKPFRFNELLNRVHDLLGNS